MHVQQFLSVLVLAACVSSGPIGRTAVPRDGRPPNVCVLIDGDDPYILDPFNRPQCACNCIKQACKQPDPAQTELCLRTPWPSPNNTAFPDTLVRYAACVGGTHCVGG
ncbi:hypothetical protein F4774DRAFT_381234 [Daldinia eschscholtzii]|nr:hypothetical protein F4774DRAFT_381234 [Daldinia eschscholtzii]